MVENTQQSQQQAIDILKTQQFTCTVSSVLMKNHKQYGKKFMYDGKANTCWYSDQGLPQFVTFKFEQAQQQLKTVKILSQGGFCPKEIAIYFDDKEVEGHEMEDSNLEQEININEENQKIKFSTVKFEFRQISDLFGRCIIYNISLISP
eukprot:403350901